MDNYLPIQLPSRCRAYSSDITPGAILARPYTGEDEMILAQINPVNIERKFLVILNRVLQGIDPKKLTVGDRLYLIIWEFINSYSETMTVRQVCSHCIKNVEFIVDMRKCPIKELDPDLSIPTSITLPVSKKQVQLRPLTVEDEIAVEELAESGQDEHHFRLAKSIVGEGDPVAVMMEMKKWPAKDLARIRYYHSWEVDHGTITTVPCKCSNCGKEEEVDIPFRFDFLYPKGQTLRDCFRA
jgi:hypothetical protein